MSNLGVLAFVTAEGIIKPKNESANAVYSRDITINKPTTPTPISVVFTGNVTGGTGALAYTVPAGRKFYVQSVDLYTGTTRGLFYLLDQTTNIYVVYESAEWDGATNLIITRQVFPSPLVFETNVRLDFSAGVYGTALTLIGYLL